MSQVAEPIARSIRLNEIPEKCGCKFKFRPLCQHTDPQGCNGPKCVRKATPDGCETRQKTGKCGCRPKRCECPNVPGPPCKHVLALRERFSKNLSFDEWQELMAGAYPEKYAEPEAPTEPVLAMNKDALLAAMELRARGRKSIRHKGDFRPEDDMALQTVKTANGRLPSRLKLTVHGGSNGSGSAGNNRPNG